MTTSYTRATAPQTQSLRAPARQSGGRDLTALTREHRSDEGCWA